MANPRIEVEIGAVVEGLKKGFGESVKIIDKLEEQAKDLEKALKNATSIDEITKLNADLARTRSSIAQLKNAGLKDFGDQAEKAGKKISSLNEFATGALQGIAAAFTVGAVVNFGKAVLDTTAKFQKFEAVLTNTLGSQSEAQKSLRQISQFASETPFQVDELTSAFVKLANQGFTPTISQLRSLGDLAASTGKSFDQLAEAIIDAQVGEFERLKEFGIRAKKEGDKVTFTFKGVETQVKNTSEAIRDYVLSLGDAEGVSGAMAKVSETLGGKISNLEDNIEALRLAIGNQTSGVFAASLDWLNAFVSQATLAAKGLREIRDAVISTQGSTDSAETRKEVDFLVKKLSETLPIQDAINRAVDITKQSYRDLGDDISKTNITAGKIGATLNELEKIRVELLREQKKENKELTEEEKKRLETNQKFYNSAIQLSTQYSEKLQEEFSFTKLIVDARKKLEEASQQVSKDIKSSEREGQIIGVSIQLPPDEQFTETAKKIKTFADFYKEVQEETDQTSQLLIDSFANLGAQISSSLNISNDALRGFVGTLLSNTPKIIQAIFQTAAANKLASEANIASSKKGALANGIFMATETGKTLGPVGLALLPVLIGGVVALISGAFRKTGSGGASVGTSGLGAGTSFTSGATGFGFAQNREIRGELVARGQDLVYVFNEANTRINKG